MSPTQRPLPPAAPWLAGAAGVLFVAGAVLAVVQPGDLGDDAGQAAVAPVTTTTAPVTTPTTASATSTTVDGSGAVDGGGEGSGGIDGSGGSETPRADGSDGGSTSGQVGSGSGLTADGAPSTTPDELSNSGHESMLLPGGLLVVAAVGGARLRRRDA